MGIAAADGSVAGCSAVRRPPLAGSVRCAHLHWGRWDLPWSVRLVVAIAVLVSAKQAWKCDPQQLLVRGAPAVTRKNTTRDLLLGLQVAVCCVLVTGCLVSLRGLQRALVVPLGFDPEGVMIASFDLAKAGYSPEEGRAFQTRALQAIAPLPGITEVAYAHSLPLTQIGTSTRFVYPEGTVEFGAGTAMEAQRLPRLSWLLRLHADAAHCRSGIHRVRRSGGAVGR